MDRFWPRHTHNNEYGLSFVCLIVIKRDCWALVEVFALLSCLIVTDWMPYLTHNH